MLELLVVFGIIAVLATMLVPALSRAREKARRANCMSNLKQMGLHIGLYADDSRERCPSASGGTATKSSVHLRLLSTMISAPRLFLCAGGIKSAAPSVALLDGANTSYHYAPDQIFARLNPDSILAVDENLPGAPGTIPEGTAFTFGTNHSTSGGNFLFNDGHVGFFVTSPTAGNFSDP